MKFVNRHNQFVVTESSTTVVSSVGRKCLERSTRETWGLEVFYPGKNQDGGIGRHTAPPHTIKRTTTI